MSSREHLCQDINSIKLNCFSKLISHLFIQDLCFLILALLQVGWSKVVFGLGHVRIILAQLWLVYFKCTLVIPENKNRNSCTESKICFLNWLTFPPPHTCPDSDRAEPGCWAAWRHRDDPIQALSREFQVHAYIEAQHPGKKEGFNVFPTAVTRTLYFPLFPYKTARLLRVAATAGWFSPRVFSLMASASLSRFAASLYLFWSLYTRARMFSMVATSGWSWPEVFSRSSKACLHRGTATSYLEKYRM